MAATDLYVAAEELLAVASAALIDTPGGPIGYQAVAQGLPAFDCEGLWVSVNGPAIGNTYPLQPPLEELQRIVTTGQVNIVTYQITVIRCLAGIVEEQGQNVLLPSAAEVSQDAYTCYADMWSIWNAVKNAHRNGVLFQRPSGRREFGMDPAVPVRTEGGYGGWVIQIRSELDGYA